MGFLVWDEGIRRCGVREDEEEEEEEEERGWKEGGLLGWKVLVEY